MLLSSLNSLPYAGVYNLRSFDDLISRGLKTAVCADKCLQRYVDRIGGVVYGSQYDWSQMVNEADRVLALPRNNSPPQLAWSARPSLVLNRADRV